jgi:polysaccharide export outer membrane protein
MKWMFALFLISTAWAGPGFSDGLTGLGSASFHAESARHDNNRDPVVPAVKASPRHSPATPPDVYVLGPGDKLRLTVFGEDDLSGTYEVDGSGDLALPLIGDVSIGGKSPREAERIITRRYAEGYLIRPRISLEILTSRPYFILGEVNKPNSYPYVSGMTVINAVAMAGGYTPRASTGTVLVRRASDPKHRETETPEDAKVYPGDVIRVEERFF